jgi:hypothetical protein
MLRFLDRNALWSVLPRLAKAAKRPSYVAVPYVGSGAAKLLPLSRGDVLLCALTEQNAKNGSVCPADLRTLRRRGVSVYLQDDLHAKVFLFGRTAIVGSSNLSKSSRDTLDDAALRTTDRDVIRQIRRWFAERTHDPLSPKWLSYCESVYQRPKPPQPARRIWIIRVQEMVLSDLEDATMERGKKQEARRLTNPKRYSIEPIRWVGRPAFRRGDLVIQIERKGRKNAVSPHGRLLNIRHPRLGLRARVAHLYVEMPKKYRTIPWARFQKECQKLRLPLRSDVLARQIRNARILSLVSPEKLARS